MQAIPSTHISLLIRLEGTAGQNEAWEEFHARYREVIFRWCRGRGVPRSCAEDLTQEVLLLLSQRLPHYHHDPERGRFRSWLQAVVHNVVTDFWRRKRRHPECTAVGSSSFLERLASIASPERSAESPSSGTTAAEIFDRVRARLKETTWQAFFQSMVEGRPATEVAARLNLSIASVYKANYRVKQMLVEEYRAVHTPRNDRGSTSFLTEDAREPPRRE